MLLPRVLPRAAVAAAALAAFWLGAAPQHAQDLNMDEIFRCSGGDTDTCGAARELILNNCTVCHTFVPIVMQQYDDAAWTGLIDRHRDRITQLSEDEIQSIRGYLAQNFNPELPPPPLPPEMLKNWTAY